MESNSFQTPFFWNYPPYFTLQPVKDSREKQINLWHDLILSYCKHQKIYVISGNATDRFPLFTNTSINRSLNQDAINTILGAAVTAGRAEWLGKEQDQCIVYWRSLKEWAELLYSFAQSTGQKDPVMTVEEISSGVETQGTELAGVHREVLVRAIRRLEKSDRARLFKGESGDDDGVKFFT
uniref:ESCRT-II complex subunit VPS25 n=1 Tax=Tetraselmis sp. GSL018 TaxID=582737 RepID=A0A061RHC1_9CHLO|mmetsp:Transcript_34561/g.81928  ORF Transcript_34561/g.81928 Transcript_34561/m.81928 type:complete len:181 (+) Transcript_34561:88-630(+)